VIHAPEMWEQLSTTSIHISRSRPVPGKHQPQEQTAPDPPYACQLFMAHDATLQPWISLSCNSANWADWSSAPKRPAGFSMSSIFLLLASRRGGPAVWSMKLQWIVAVALPAGALPDVPGSRKAEGQSPPRPWTSFLLLDRFFPASWRYCLEGIHKSAGWNRATPCQVQADPTTWKGA